MYENTLSEEKESAINKVSELFSGGWKGLGVSMPLGMYETLALIAKRKGITKSRLIQLAIKDFLTKNMD